MYAYIKGTVVDVTPTHATIETGGIGYFIDIPASTYAHLKVGKEAQLFTAFIVRETAQLLFGFVSPGEKELFETLIGVSGVGPKLALALIGHLPLQELQEAIANSDHRTISRVPGIGKRTAERLIVELRDKLPGLFPRDVAAGPAAAGSGTLTRDACSALTNLGYTQAMAQKALDGCKKEIEDNVPLPELITAALKQI